MEEALNLNDLSPAVKKGFTSQLKGGTVQKVESVTTGNTVTYEATVSTKGKRNFEVAVNADRSAHRN